MVIFSTPSLKAELLAAMFSFISSCYIVMVITCKIYNLLAQLYPCMSDTFHERLDSDVIRQGLLSIRNSQIELLNELKSQTQQLRKNPIRFTNSTDQSKSDQSNKMDQIFSYPPENVNSEVRYNPPPAPPAGDKAYSFGVTGDKMSEQDSGFMRDENKMLNETIQKLLYSRSMDKERIRELESYLYFSEKMNLQLVGLMLNGGRVGEIKRVFENDLDMNKDVYGKYQENNHHLILQMLQEKEGEELPSRVSRGSGGVESAKEREINAQLGQLKEQLALLMKNNTQKNEKSASEAEGARWKEQEEALTRKCDEFQKRVVKLDSDNKELALCWQREINERKALIVQLQRLRKDSSSNQEADRQAVFAQRDLQGRLSNTLKVLKEKQGAQIVYNDNMRKLSDTIGLLKEQNQRLKRQIKSIDQIRKVLQRQDQYGIRQAENEMKAKIVQQGQMLRNYEKEIFDLRNHLGEVKKNQEMLAVIQAKHKENEVMNQEIYWRKVQAIKTNSTVEHLWQVKKVEFDNMNEVLQELRDKSKRV